jgi:hypothetical protein
VELSWSRGEDIGLRIRVAGFRSEYGWPDASIGGGIGRVVCMETHQSRPAPNGPFPHSFGVGSENLIQIGVEDPPGTLLELGLELMRLPP